jgi:hypothetical protein
MVVPDPLAKDSFQRRRIGAITDVEEVPRHLIVLANHEGTDILATAGIAEPDRKLAGGAFDPEPMETSFLATAARAPGLFRPRQSPPTRASTWSGSY